MKKIYIFLYIPLTTFSCLSQVIQTDTLSAGFVHTLKAVALFHDSLSSSFFIRIPSEVPLHKHLHHAEQVVILKGNGRLILGEKQFSVGPKDVIYIPKNTPHALYVSGSEPVECISIQAPYFDGRDRIWMNQKKEK